MASFVTADLHLDHDSCATVWRKFFSVKQHNTCIIDNWNSNVRSTRDVVYILGDACFRPATSLHLLEQLNGIKHLILGNHEHHDISRYIKYFNRISVMSVYKERYLFTHIPVHESQMTGRFINCVNIHGHVHKGQDELYIRDPRYFNVNVEFHDYAPIRIEDLDEMVARKKEGLFDEYLN